MTPATRRRSTIRDEFGLRDEEVWSWPVCGVLEEDDSVAVFFEEGGNKRGARR